MQIEFENVLNVNMIKEYNYQNSLVWTKCENR